MAEFQPNLAQRTLWYSGSKFIQIKVHYSISKGRRKEKSENSLMDFRFFFHIGTTLSIKIKLGENVLGYRVFKIVQIKGQVHGHFQGLN